MAGRGGAKDKLKDPEKRRSLGSGGGVRAAKETDPPFNKTYGVGVLARLFGVNPATIYSYIRDGIIPPPEKKGQYDLMVCTHAMLAWWQEKSMGKTKGAAAATERLNQARAEQEELKLQELKRSLVPAGEADKALVMQATICRARLLQLPDRAAPRMEHVTVEERRRILQEEVDALLEEICSVVIDIEPPAATTEAA